MKKIALSLFLAILVFALPQTVSTSPGSEVVYVFFGWLGLDDFGFTGWHDPGSGTVGDWGSGDGEFDTPRGIAVDSDGNIYVADTNNDRIQKFDSDGNFITKWGSYGSGDSEFNEPWGVAVDSDGNVYVADKSNHRIQKFDSSGNHLATWGSYGSGNGEFNRPRGVAVDSDGNIYVADTNNYRIQKLDSNGGFITKWGTFGFGDAQFWFTGDVAVDSGGNVYVADSWNDRIQKFDSSGNHLATWGSYGSGNGEFYDPWGVAVDSDGNVYVADSSNDRIQKFDSSGALLGWWGLDDLGDTRWHDPDTERIGNYDGLGDGQFWFPEEMAVDSDGNIYVADTLNDRIQKIGPVPPPVADAGDDQTVSADEYGKASVTLDGSDSYDPGGEELTYEWKDSLDNIIGTTAEVKITLEFGEHTFTLTVSNINGAGTDEVMITVEDKIPPVPEAATLPTLEGECSVEITTAPTAKDNCAGIITGTTTAPLPITFTAQGPYTVKWTYDDGNGNTYEQMQSVIVQDITSPVPEVSTLPTLEGECSVEITTAPTAKDNCAGIITGTTTAPLPITFTAQGPHTVKWTYDDGNGNTATQTQTVIVEDITPPVPDAETLPTVEGECSAEITTAPTAKDNCAGVITGTTTDPLEYTKSGTYTVTWVYDDGNGNTATQTQTVKVEDITPPTIQLSDSTCVNINKWKIANMLTVSASDNCSSDVELVLDKIKILNKYGRRVWGRGIYSVVGNDIYVFPNGRDWSIVVTVTASDSNGNTKTESLSKPLLQCNRWSAKMARLIRLLYILIWKWHRCW
jgi:streptogramin lyase